MMKQLLAKNKIVQRVKAVKDLFLEKLDSLSHVQLEQIQKLEKLEKLNQLDPLDFKVDQLNNSTEQIRQENAETRRKADLSMENQAFLLKFSVDIVKNLQLLTEDWKQKGDLILNNLLKIQEANQKILEDIHALRALGVSAIDFNFLGSTAEKVLGQMESFRTSVMERI
jgi:hypothetical protein